MEKTRATAFDRMTAKQLREEVIYWTREAREGPNFAARERAKGFAARAKDMLDAANADDDAAIDDIAAAMRMNALAQIGRTNPDRAADIMAKAIARAMGPGWRVRPVELDQEGDAAGEARTVQ